MAAGLGLVAGLGQVPFSLTAATLLGLTGAVMLLAVAQGPRAAAVLGWAVGAGYFLTTLHWIVEPFLIDLARHGWMAPFALVLFAGGMALFWAGAAWLWEMSTMTGCRISFLPPIWRRTSCISIFAPRCICPVSQKRSR